MAAKKHKGSKKTSDKLFADKRTVNPPQEGAGQQNQGQGNHFQDQDEARRLGGFETAGEHARTGNPGHE